MSYRPTFPPDLYKEFKILAQKLGYKTKGEYGRWKLQKKMIEYVKSHPNSFSLL